MADKRTAVAGETTEPSTKVATEREMRRGIEINRLGLKRRTGLCVGYWAAFAAVAGFGTAGKVALPGTPISTIPPQVARRGTGATARIHVVYGERNAAGPHRIR